MSNNTFRVLIMAVSVWAGVQVASAQAIHDESGGLVIMEAENTESPLDGDPAHPWVRLSPGDANYLAGAAGSQHLEFTGNTVENGPPRSPLQYKFKINQGGRYWFEVRGRQRLEPGVAKDKSNDCYVRMDGNFTSDVASPSTDDLKQNHKLFINGGTAADNWGNGWFLEFNGNSFVNRYQFEAGEIYTLTISGRSQNFNLDRIIIWKGDRQGDRDAAIDPANPESDTFFIDPGTLDDDEDGLSNALEDQIGIDPFDPDTDGDGLNDFIEHNGDSDPLIADTDGDGIDDGAEISSGTDPTNANDPIPQTIEPRGEIVLNATSDFPVIDAGQVPYQLDNNHHALMINARNESNRGKFGRAETTFSSAAGFYNVFISALRETDGESTYRLYVNGKLKGESQNSPTSMDNDPQHHLFTSIQIPAGATLAVESNSDSNEKIPEGDGFAWARGRWTALTLEAIDPEITGQLRQWHKVTLNLTGPNTSETAGTNPFQDVRLNVTFTHPGTGKTYVVPGFYAADGDAGNTSSESGDQWKAHFRPDETGEWNYTVSFRTGTDVAMKLDSDKSGSTPWSPLDGQTGTFTVHPSDKVEPDLRAPSMGRVVYDGTRYLKYAGSGKTYLKAGEGSPENFLGYDSSRCVAGFSLPPG